MQDDHDLPIGHPDHVDNGVAWSPSEGWHKASRAESFVRAVNRLAPRDDIGHLVDPVERK